MNTSSLRLVTTAPPSSWEAAVDDFIIYLRASGRKAKTAAFYTGQLSLLARWATGRGTALEDFTGRDLARYIVQRSETPARGHEHPISKRTLHADALCAKVFMAWCKREGLIDIDRLADYEVKKPARSQPPIPSEQDVVNFLASILERYPAATSKEPAGQELLREFSRRRNYAIVTALLDTAARPNEILALEQTNYDRRNLRLTFVDTKTADKHEVPISEFLPPLIDDWLAVRPQASKSTKVFVTEAGTNLSVGGWSQWFRGQQAYAEKRFGVSAGWTLYGLRHYAATKLAEQSVLGTQAIMGHRSLATTQGYLHQNIEHARATQRSAGVLESVLVNARSRRQRAKSLIRGR